MTHTSTPRRRWRRTALATAGISLIAAVAPLVGANPAAAVNASLTTTDGVGIRVDENAIVGPALQAIENALQPYVNQKIYEGALANSVMDDPDWVQGTANVDLSIDFVNAGTTGYPQGGLKVRADLNNIMMRFYRYGEWWQPECQFRVNPDPGYINASAKVNAALLPNAPLQMNPITAYWDEDPAITREVGNWLCTGYLIDEWWDGLWGSGTSVATQLENELNGDAQGLINDLWSQHVTPVINSLNEFGITFNQIRTDDNGLIVTANTNAGGPTGTGMTIPGIGGPFNVSNTPDSGVTSNINTVLAARREVTVSIHPNVVAQVLNALKQGLTGEWGFLDLSSSIETVLLPTAARAAYDDSQWYMRYVITSEPSVTPTGTGGRPVVNLPGIMMEVYNFSVTDSLVATFTGTLSGLSLLAEVRPGSTTWGPSIWATNATLGNLVRTQANGDALSPTATQMQPFARTHWDRGSEAFFVGILSLPPITIGGLAVSLCTSTTTCPRVTGDQRFTEFFNIA